MNYLQTILGAVPHHIRHKNFQVTSDESGNWHCAMSRGKVAELVVPMSSSELATVVRVHELLHAHLHRKRLFSPTDLVGQETYAALTDTEVHAAMAATMSGELNRIARQVLASQCLEKLEAFREGRVSPFNLANFALRTMAQGAVVRADLLGELGVPNGLCQIAERAIRRHFQLLQGGLRVAKTKAFRQSRKNLADIIQRIMALLARTDELLSAEPSDSELLAELLHKLLEGNRQPSVMNIVELPRERPTCPRIRSTRYVPMGGRLSRRAPQALATQRADILFARRRPPSWNGTILIDASSSMLLEPAELAALIAACPMGQVAMYSGKGDQVGYLVVFARNGRMVADIRKVIRDYQYAGNDVDAEAITWLLAQPAPRVMVTDKHFVFTKGGSVYADVAAIQLCARAERMGRIKVVRRLEEVLPLVSSL